MEKIVNRFLVSILVVVAVFAFISYRGINQTSMLNYFVLTVITFYVVFKGLHEEFIFNPYLLFILTPISLMIYDVSVSTHYLEELNQSTYNLAIYNMVCILIGFHIAKRVRFKNPSLVWDKGDNLDIEACSAHAYRLLLLGLYPTLYGCIRGIGCILALDLNGTKEIINSAPLASVFQLFLYPAIICAVYSRKRKTISVVFMALLMSMVLNFSKTTLVMLCVAVLLAFYNIISIEQRGKFKFIVLTVVALVAFYYSFDIYNSIRHDFDDLEYFTSLGYVGNISNAWFLPIMYLISPWVNLQYIVQNTTVHSFGLWAVKPFLSYFQIDGLFSELYELVPRYEAFNTYTYISQFYRDFGTIGSGLESIILGYFIMKIFMLFQEHRTNPFVNAIYVLVAYATAMLFFNNHFLQLSYPITILIIMWIYCRLFVSGNENGVE